MEKKVICNEPSKPIYSGIAHNSAVLHNEEETAPLIPDIRQHETRTQLDSRKLEKNSIKLKRKNLKYASMDDSNTIMSSIMFTMINSWILCLATVLYGLSGVFIRLSQLESPSVAYNSAAVFLLVECAKLFASLALLIKEGGLLKAFNSIQNLTIREWVMFAFPAVLYAGSNNLDIYLLRYMDPSSQQMLAQMKVATTVICWWTVFRKPLSREQWIALLLLMLGSVCIASPRDSISKREMYVLPFGVVLLFFQVWFSAMAGVSTEWMFKHVGLSGRSCHRENICMCMWGIIANYILMEIISEPAHRWNITHGFNFYTYLIIIIYTAKGLATAHILKWFSSIIKLLANAGAMFFSHFLTWYLFGLVSAWPHNLGLVAVGCALVIFNYHSPFNLKDSIH